MPAKQISFPLHERRATPHGRLLPRPPGSAQSAENLPRSWLGSYISESISSQWMARCQVEKTGRLAGRNPVELAECRQEHSAKISLCRHTQDYDTYGDRRRDLRRGVAG